MTQMIEGVLELDLERGVLYFHSSEGRTVLRVCRLPKVNEPPVAIDITHMRGVSYERKEEE